MKIRLNGKHMDIGEDMTISDLLKEKGIESANVVVEHNFEILKFGTWSSISLKENDNIEILKFIGGG